MNEFLAMGGYAVFVWPAYGASVIVLVALVIASRRRLKRLEQALAQAEGRASMEDEA